MEGLRKNTIDDVREKIIRHSNSKTGLGLEKGKMGTCIYFFKMFELSGDSQYLKKAEKLFDEICKSLALESFIMPITEMVYIGIGIDYLFYNRFLNGDINEILGDFDDRIFLKLTAVRIDKVGNSATSSEAIPALYYALIRLGKLKKGSDAHFMTEELSIKLFNDLYVSLKSNFFEEPLRFLLGYRLPQLLFVIAKMYALNFYNYRLDEVIKELIFPVSSRIPVLHSNRLYLLWGLTHLKKETLFTIFDEQIQFLSNHIDFHKIVNEELKNRDVFINDGVSGIYLLLADLEKMNCKLLCDKKLFMKKIENSDVWGEKRMESESLGLLNGLCGAILVYHLLEKELKENEA